MNNTKYTENEEDDWGFFVDMMEMGYNTQKQSKIFKFKHLDTIYENYDEENYDEIYKNTKIEELKFVIKHKNNEIEELNKQKNNITITIIPIIILYFISVLYILL